MYLFNDADKNSHSTASSDYMITVVNWKGYGRKLSLFSLIYRATANYLGDKKVVYFRNVYRHKYEES
jgi:hypothetical protein